MRISHIKFLRKALIGLIALVLLAVAFNYIQTWRKRSRVVTRAAKILGAEMLRSADSIEYSEHENGLLKFKVRAEKLLETRQGKNMLQGIEAFDFNPDGSIRNHIRSRRAEYDRSAKRALFSGDVQLQMGEGVELQTESLHYDLQSNLGETDDRIKLISPQASGTARGVRYEHAQNRLELYHELDFTLKRSMKRPDGSVREENVRVTSQRGYYSEPELFLRFQGNARLESETDILSGNDIEATFSPDRKQVTSLLCQGGASYVSKDPSESRALRGDRIRFGIVPTTGSLEKIEVLGQASYSSKLENSDQELRASSISFTLDPAKGLPKELRSHESVSYRMNRAGETTEVTGENLEAAFTRETSLLDRMRVWGKAQMSSRSGDDPEKDELQAEEIRMVFQDLEGRTALRELQAERSVRWKTPPRRKKPEEPPQAGRSLTADTLRIAYAAGGDYPESGSAFGGVVLSGIPMGEAQREEIRRLEADTVRFRFWRGGNRLREFEGEGRVAVFCHKPGDPEAEIPGQEFRTRSSNLLATFRERDGVAQAVSQWGSFVYQDGARTAAAGRGDYQAEQEVLVLQESPTISDANSTTTGVRMEFNRKKGVLSVQQRVRSVLRQGTAAAGTPFRASEQASSPTIVTADNMQYWNEDSRARYSGTVLLLSEDGQLQCRVLEILKGGERVEAEGNIRHILFRKQSAPEANQQKETTPGKMPGNPRQRIRSRITVQSPRLRYLKEQNSVHYSEKVTLSSEDVWMSSESLDVVLDPIRNLVEQAAARGSVFIKESGREVRGEFADYYVSPGKVVVVGNPAEMRDPQRVRSRARRLTFFTMDDRILIENH